MVLGGSSAYTYIRMSEMKKDDVATTHPDSATEQTTLEHTANDSEQSL